MIKNIVLGILLLPFAFYALKIGNTELAFFLFLSSGILLLPVVWRLWITESENVTLHYAFIKVKNIARKSFNISLVLILISLIFTKISIWPILFGHNNEIIYYVKKDRQNWMPLFILDVMNTGSKIQKDIRVSFELDKIPFSPIGFNAYYKRYKPEKIKLTPQVLSFCKTEKPRAYHYFSDHKTIDVKKSGEPSPCGHLRQFVIHNLEPGVKIRFILTFEANRDKQAGKALNKLMTDIQAKGEIYKSHPEFTHIAKAIYKFFNPF